MLTLNTISGGIAGLMEKEIGPDFNVVPDQGVRLTLGSAITIIGSVIFAVASALGVYFTLAARQNAIDERVTRLEMAISERASKDTVQLQYEGLIQRLERIERKIDQVR